MKVLYIIHYMYIYLHEPLLYNLHTILISMLMLKKKKCKQIYRLIFFTTMHLFIHNVLLHFFHVSKYKYFVSCIINQERGNERAFFFFLYFLMANSSLFTLVLPSSKIGFQPSYCTFT